MCYHHLEPAQCVDRPASVMLSMQSEPWVCRSETMRCARPKHSSTHAGRLKTTATAVVVACLSGLNPFQMFLQLACQTSSYVLTRCGPDRGLSCSHAGMLALRAQRDHASDRSGTRGRLFVYVAHNLRRPTSFSWFASDAYTARHECSCCLEGGTTAANSPVFDEYIEHCA